MYSLISINNNFVVITPKDLVNLILESKYCRGNTVEEKIKDYLASIDYVSVRIKDNSYE